MRRTLGLGLLVLLMCGPALFAAAPEPPGDRLARAYGIKGWAQVQQIAFTFNVKLPDKAQVIRRSWIWTPKTDAIVAHADTDEPILFHGREASDDEVIGELHHQFINDSYWLLFPFQLVWSNPTVTVHGEAALPIGEGTATKLTAQWPEEGGYTPGDAYDLYLGEDGLIEQWVFRRGGGEAGMPATWDEHRRLGPIIVSLSHENADGSFRLWFTDVKVEIEHEEGWQTPAPIDGP